ncbi:uncharacterized protein B0H18DRAFT_1114126 [Fomitopsis serialis]|uniref:uncharacterized protein n=1 Tax=Fomitopsis serialis TaxID=139415 RepID=UPI0020078E5A|nr:uncharacterized protein B0H18DRAFT_1114126 [Neoantrodia serialis]KAH9935368.1 hypothetical protein B0H18DRAFT_1114126 [Neoantrodia serialis]
MRLGDLDDYSLSSVVSLLSQCDSLNLSLTSRRIHPLARRHALSTIDIKTAAQLERISSYLLADVPNRLHFVRALTVFRVAFDPRGRHSEAEGSLLADVLERAPHLKTLRLEAAGALFEAEPRVASATCRLDQLVHVDLRGLSSASLEVVDRLSCAPRQLSLHGAYPRSHKDCCDATSLLSAPVMRSVRSLHLRHFRIADQQVDSVEDGLYHTPPQWPELRDLKIEHSYVSAATLVYAFPTVKAIHFKSRKSMEVWEKKDAIKAFKANVKIVMAGTKLRDPLPRLEALASIRRGEWTVTTETACWGYLDWAYGTSEDFTNWEITFKVRWLMLHSESDWSSVSQILPILQRTLPVVLSLQGLPALLERPMMFWPEFVRIAPRIRYLDLTLSCTDTLDSDFNMYWTDRVFSALSELPLFALRLCRSGKLYAHDMDESRLTVYPRWSSAICDLAAHIAGMVTSLHIISVGEGVQVYNRELSRYRFCGHALWWRIVPNDEPPSANVDREEDAGESVHSGSSDGDVDDEGSAEEGSTHGETIDPNPKLARTLGPSASRKMVPISRDLGEHIRIYMESSEFTETSAFDDELFERLARTAVPREVVSEP